MPGKTVVRTSKLWPSTGPYSQGICVPPGRGLLFTAGLVARDAEGGVVAPYDTEAQLRRIVDDLALLVAEAGCTLDDVVKMTVYLRDIEGDLEVVRRVRSERWPERPPASTGVEVARLMRDEIRVELDAVVLLPPAGGAGA